MIDAGFWEIAMIGVLALIILGPERLPGVARTAGAWMGKARRMMNDLKADIKTELDQSDIGDFKEIRDDIQKTGERFKSQLESNENTLQAQGSSMDTAIADALNKAPLDKDRQGSASDISSSKQNADAKPSDSAGTAAVKATDEMLNKKPAVNANISPKTDDTK